MNEDMNNHGCHLQYRGKRKEEILVNITQEKLYTIYKNQSQRSTSSSKFPVQFDSLSTLHLWYTAYSFRK